MPGLRIASVQFSWVELLSCSVAQSSPVLWDPMDCTTPGSLSFTVSRSCSDSCPLSQWCHSTISSSVVPFFSHLQSFPASGSFPMSQFFESGGQSTGASTSTSVLPESIQGWFPLRFGCFDLLAFQGTLKSLFQHHGSKASILQCSAFFMVQLSHPHMSTGKNIALTRWTFVSKVMSVF